MASVVDVVRGICAEKRIRVAKLERDLGFSNGYLNPKRISAIPSDRLVRIADYLNVSVNHILKQTEFGTKKEPVSVVVPETELDEQRLSLLAIYDSLPPDKQAIMLEMAKAFHSQEQAGRKEKP